MRKIILILTCLLLTSCVGLDEYTPSYSNVGIIYSYYPSYYPTLRWRLPAPPSPRRPIPQNPRPPVNRFSGGQGPIQRGGFNPRISTPRPTNPGRGGLKR